MRALPESQDALLQKAPEACSYERITHLWGETTLDLIEALRRSRFYALHTKKEFGRIDGSPRLVFLLLLHWTQQDTIDKSGFLGSFWSGRETTTSTASTGNYDRQDRQVNQGHEQLEDDQYFHHTRASEAFLFSSSTRGMAEKEETELGWLCELSHLARTGRKMHGRLLLFPRRRKDYAPAGSIAGSDTGLPMMD